jgi:hypothetical protein
MFVQKIKTGIKHTGFNYFSIYTHKSGLLPYLSHGKLHLPHLRLFFPMLQDYILPDSSGKPTLFQAGSPQQWIDLLSCWIHQEGEEQALLQA